MNINNLTITTPFIGLILIGIALFFIDKQWTITIRYRTIPVNLICALLGILFLIIGFVCMTK